MQEEQHTQEVSLAPVPITYLRAWRLERGMTQVQLARRARVARRTIASAEAGKPVWRVTAARLARALGIDVRTLRGAAPAEEDRG